MTKIKGNERFYAELDRQLAGETDLVHRSALLLQSLTHREWMRWIALHAEGNMGGGVTCCKAASDWMGGMMAELAFNLTNPGQDPTLTIDIMLDRIKMQALGCLELYSVKQKDGALEATEIDLTRQRDALN